MDQLVLRLRVATEMTGNAFPAITSCSFPSSRWLQADYVSYAVGYFRLTKLPVDPRLNQIYLDPSNSGEKCLGCFVVVIFFNVA